MSEPTDAELLALLQGDLPVEEEERMEKLLSKSERARHRLEQLSGAASFSKEFGDVELLDAESDDTDLVPEIIEKIRTQGFVKTGNTKSSPDLSFYRSLFSPSDVADSEGRLGEFEVRRLIAAGGMGAVFEGWDPKLKRRVAIKILSLHLAADEEARERFLLEASAVAAIEHENVVPIFAINEIDGLPYLVMRFVEGHTLEEWIGHRDFDALLKVLAAAAHGLEAAHATGVIHRDIKPGNVLVEPATDGVWLTDFGLARVLGDPGRTMAGVIMGTPHYMSPEQADGQPVDQRADLFSFGAMLYHLASGEPAFMGDTSTVVLKKVSDVTYTPLAKRCPQLPGWFNDLVDWLMQRDPKSRPASAAIVAECLEKRRLPNDIIQNRKRRNRHRVALITSVVMSVVAFVFLGPRSSYLTGLVADARGHSYDHIGTWASYSTLAETFEKAPTHSVIELRKEGRSTINRAQLTDKKMTLRPAQNRFPILEVDGTGGAPVIHAVNSQLRVEGIGFDQPLKSGFPPAIFRIDGGEFSMDHCRVIQGKGVVPRNEFGAHPVLDLRSVERAQILNSEWVIGIGNPLLITCDDPIKSSIEIENSVIGYRSGIASGDGNPDASVDVRVSDSLLISVRTFWVFSDDGTEDKVVFPKTTFHLERSFIESEFTFFLSSERSTLAIFDSVAISSQGSFFRVPETWFRDYYRTGRPRRPTIYRSSKAFAEVFEILEDSDFTATDLSILQSTTANIWSIEDYDDSTYLSPAEKLPNCGIKRGTTGPGKAYWASRSRASEARDAKSMR